MTYSADRNPTMPAVLRAFGKDLQSKIYTSIPGKVESFDASRKSADVKPMVQNEFINERGETVQESLPVLSDVPICYPEGGGNVLTFPLSKGDFVLLVFAQRSVDKYLSGNGEEVAPIDLRMHSISDAFAIPGFAPYSQRPSQAVDPDGIVIGRDGGTQVFIGDSCIGLNGKSAADKVSLDSKVQENLDRLKTELDQITQWMNAVNGVLIGAPINEPGNGSPSALQTALNLALTVPPSPVPTPGTPTATNSDIVKVD